MFEQGLERVVISKIITRFFHEKIEKLALDLVKLENEQFSLLALKLLVTCMYIGELNYKICLFLKNCLFLFLFFSQPFSIHPI